MAIVINGSGTISGISVGGLPDSIVDAGTLATNSVDSAELIDGSVDASHLADGNNTPSFSVRLSSDQSIPNATYTKVTFDSENWDTDSAFASGTFTVPSGQAGKYLFTFHCNIGLLDATKTVLARLYVNGSNYQYAHNSVVSDAANWGAFVLATAVINLSVGHTVEAYCYQGNGTNLDALATGNEFSGFKLIGV